MLERERQNASDDDAEKDYLSGIDSFRRGHYCDAIDYFAASIEKGIEITNSRFYMAQAMVRLKRFDEAEQLLNQIETDDASMSHQIDMAKVTLYLAQIDYSKENYPEENYKRAFAVLDKRMNGRATKHHITYWCYAYLATILGKEIDLPLPEAFRARSQLNNSPNQTDIAQINLAQTNVAQINLALMDYKSVDYHRMSGNIGDYIQTVAVMRHIARHLPDNALIEGDANINSDWQIGSESLKSSLAFLRESWSENERRHITSNSKIRGKIVIADRDAAWNLTARQENNKAENNAPIWYPVFGWFAHQPFNLVPVIPLPSQYLPIFFSFHLRYPEHLTEAYIDYLKRFAPIGCRDIATRDLLMNQGVDAFFSGCVTTTLSFAGEVEPSNEMLDVEAHMKPSAIHITHIGEEFKNRSFDDNIETSLALLRRFRNAKKVITSRLHCYLPTRALGGYARFIHKHKADTRFDGLIDIDDKAFDDIRDGLTDLLDKILGKIMAGGSRPEEIYAYWRELTMPLVEKTKLERSQYKPFFIKRSNQAVKSDVMKSDKKPVSEVPIALAFDKNIIDYVPALINSIEANKSCDTRYIMLVRDLPDDKIKVIEKACGQSPVQWFAMDEYLKGAKFNIGSAITVSTMDRLFLPELLPDIDKILYLDIDMIVTGDIAELYQMELGDALLAAREGLLDFSKIESCDFKHLPIDKLLALRKSASVSINLLSCTFNAGMLLLSLEKMRQDNFTEQAARFAVTYQMHDQNVLNFYANDNFIKLPKAWNGFAIHEKLSINEQKIFHWIGGHKPWHTNRNVPFRHLWQQYADMQN